MEMLTTVYTTRWGKWYAILK